MSTANNADSNEYRYEFQLPDVGAHNEVLVRSRSCNSLYFQSISLVEEVVARAYRHSQNLLRIRTDKEQRHL